MAINVGGKSVYRDDRFDVIDFFDTLITMYLINRLGNRCKGRDQQTNLASRIKF